MKLAKTTVICMIILFMLSTGVISAYADTNNEGKAVYTISENELVQRKKLILGVNENLYVEFSNQENEIEKIYNAQRDFINKISSYCKVEKLNNANWKDFRDAFYKYVDENCISESSNEYRDMVCFFDIYENKDKNERIISFVNENNLSTSLAVKALSTNNTKGASIYNELLMMQPSTSNLVELKSNEIKGSNILNNDCSIMPFAIVKSFDTSKGIAYAEKYATKRNTPTYYSFSRGDCANFTSQILENGGVKQTVYNNVSQGWWHKTSKILGITRHKHSEAWSMADTFARYMGVSKKTKTHKTFAANLRAGDFITVDFTSDGDWDHMGFVTKRDSSAGSYGYIDYKVAQHTTDYHAWASNSTNGWETHNGKGTYAIVRR